MASKPRKRAPKSFPPIDWPQKDLDHAQLCWAVDAFLLAETSFEEERGAVRIPTAVWDEWMRRLGEARVGESIPLRRLLDAACAYVTPGLGSESETADKHEKRLGSVRWTLNHAGRAS